MYGLNGVGLLPSTTIHAISCHLRWDAMVARPKLFCDVLLFQRVRERERERERERLYISEKMDPAIEDFALVSNRRKERMVASRI
jgi:hypothetical protein